jgi:Uma2 family endonuclease
MSQEEFDAWRDPDVKAEYVDGEVFVMSPVSNVHDVIFHFLSALLHTYLELRPLGTIKGSEFVVRLRPGLRRSPDLFFVNADRRDRIRSSYFDGAPDAAFEIVSVESIDRDYREKLREYAEAGVTEYWIIDPAHQAVLLYQLSEGRYQVQPAEADGRLESSVIEGFWLKPEWLWQDPLPGVLGCLREMGVLPD